MPKERALMSSKTIEQKIDEPLEKQFKNLLNSWKTKIVPGEIKIVDNKYEILSEQSHLLGSLVLERKIRRLIKENMSLALTSVDHDLRRAAEGINKSRRTRSVLRGTTLIYHASMNRKVDIDPIIIVAESKKELSRIIREISKDVKCLITKNYIFNKCSSGSFDVPSPVLRVGEGRLITIYS